MRIHILVQTLPDSRGTVTEFERYGDVAFVIVDGEDEGREDIVSSLGGDEFFEDCVAGNEESFAWFGEFEADFDVVHRVCLRGEGR